MKINELKEIEKAPLHGQLLCCTRKKVIFEPYQSVESIRKLLADDEILEIHLFDESKEYRALASHKGVIEHLADFDISNPSDVYSEDMFLDLNDYKNRVLVVYNHIHYDNHGMIAIDDYRLAMGGSHE